MDKENGKQTEAEERDVALFRGICRLPEETAAP